MNILKRKREWEKSEKGKRVTVNIMLCVFAAFNVCFFTPLDFFISNVSEIVFPLFPVVISATVVFAAVFAALFLICALTRGKANDICRLIIFGFSLAFYIQANYLSLNMGVLDGQKYSVPFWKTALNIVIWLVILAAPFVIRKKNKELCGNIVYYVSAAVVAIQIVTLIYSGTMLYVNATDDPKYNFIFNSTTVPYCSAKDFELYSENKNVIVIIADEYDSYLFDGTMKEAPETLSEFDGFTYYTNALGRYAFTDITISYITSGGINEDAYKDLTFYQTVTENFRTNFYTDAILPPPSIVENYCDNIAYETLTVRETAVYVAKIYRLVFFRGMPEALKPLLWFDGQDINVGIEKLLGKRFIETSGLGLYDCHDLEFYNNLPRELSTTDEDVFKYIYTRGLHAPRTITKDLEYCDESATSPEDTAIAVNKIINEYLRILKENGVYDNSEIIFMADHGLTGHNAKKYPLFMYKPANQTEKGIKISRAPISYEELFPTLKMLAGGEPGGRTIFDIAEDEHRTRIFSEADYEINETEKPRE